MKALWNWLAAKKAARNVVDSVKTSISPTMVESLEDRCFLSVVAPHVVSVYADNRGLMTIKLDQKLNPTSVSSKSVKVWKATAGADQAITNASIKYSAKARTITINAKTSADTVFKVRLLSKIIKSTTGVRLDGEFKTGGKSGNGRAGGDYFAMTAAPSEDVARFTTNMGNMDVQLFTSQTPITVQNFLGYTNSGDWDGVIFHRTQKNFVIQGGAFKVSSANQFTQIHSNPPTIQNEPHPGAPGNIRGTIAMARIGGQVNSASDQWYFNAADNRNPLDSTDQGFTVFGQITNAAGLAVMDKINAVPSVNLDDATPPTGGGPTIQQALAHFFNPGSLQGVFTQFALKGTPTVQTFSPKVNSVIVTRLAVNQTVVKGVKI